ncbi:MAG: CoA transferase, partial [Betaproteobacteria bacterium]
LCDVVEHPEWAHDERFASNAQRLVNRHILIPLLETVLVNNTRQHWLDKLYAAQVPAAPVNNLDGAFGEPPVAEREMIVEYMHPQVGRVRMPGNPIKFEGIDKTLSSPAPMLGEHTETLLTDLLQLTPERIAQLRQLGAIH